MWVIFDHFQRRKRVKSCILLSYLIAFPHGPPLRIEYHGAVYHVTSRGNARKAIFRDDADRNDFLATLGRVVERLVGYAMPSACMDDRYHLLGPF